jgi:hypothetical protein
MSAIFKQTDKRRQKRIGLVALGFVLLGVFGVNACSRPSRANHKTDQTAVPSTPTHDRQSLVGKSFSDLFDKGDSISYLTYNINKLYKTVRLDSLDVEVSYAVLKQEGKVVSTFDGVYFGAGNGTQFGLASLLGGTSEQLIVSQTIPRGGRHWLVDLGPTPTTLFDSDDFQVGREEVFLFDFEQDGVMELGLELPAFYMFEGMAPSVTPLPVIIFKYESSMNRYLPASHHYDYGLENIHRNIAALDSRDDPQLASELSYLPPRLDILLRYVFAGKADEGWAFFDNGYTRPDLNSMKKKIKDVLNKQPVYQFIYNGRLPRGLLHARKLKSKI